MVWFYLIIKLEQYYIITICSPTLSFWLCTKIQKLILFSIFEIQNLVLNFSFNYGFSFIYY